MPKYVEYADYYDTDHAVHNDISFYIECARSYQGPTLELACGTGRILLPLVQAGIEASGLDSSQRMLGSCRRKLEDCGLVRRVELFCEDMSAFDLPFKEYAFIFVAARSFMHLYSQTNQLSCLKRVHDHLRQGGAFIIDVYSPNSHMMSQKPDQPFTVTAEYDLPNGNHVIRSDRFVLNDPCLQIQYTERRFAEYNKKGILQKETTVPLDTRYTFRYELTLMLERVGLKVESLYRDYQRNPFDGTGEIIAIASK